MKLISPKHIHVNIEDEMKKSYLDYAMSVIIGRAIPDIRDGLKPVHRRVLFAMHQLNNSWNKSYKKSARIVGDIIGKYHPHGDAAAYDSIVRMAQNFSMRYPLIDGQGNFGSIDGDSAAAMRYTEIRMSRIADEFLFDLDKETVDFQFNYDNSLKEPSVLPTKIPSLLLNGASGIAVGVATNIPPHNLIEIINATIAMINNPQITIKELMTYIKGPDFPTAGIINGNNGIISAYTTGKGLIKIRSKVIIEKNKRTEKESIIITEIPYQINKASLLEKISQLVKEKKITSISDLRDESDRDGIRIVIDLKKDEPATITIQQLYKFTQMESSFGMIMLAINNGQPKLFNLKEILEEFIEFRKNIILRKTIFELKKANEKAHILEGLLVASKHINNIITLIKSSNSSQNAAIQLCKNLQLSNLQAKSILDMRLQKFTSMEVININNEYKECLFYIKKFKNILSNTEQVLNIIKQELEEVKVKYGDQRKTEILAENQDITIEDIIVDEEMVVTITHHGYIKRNPISLYRSQHRGGRGKIAITTKEEDFLENIFISSTHNYILIFTNKGKVHWLKVYQVPQAGLTAKGKAIINLINIVNGEHVAAILPIKNFISGNFVVMITSKGIIKKTKLDFFSKPRSSGIIAISIDKDDQLIDARQTKGNQDIFLATTKGMAIRFNENDVRTMGRNARGIIGIRIQKDDKIIGMEIINDNNSIMTISEKGYGKRTHVKEYRLQNRGGKGIINLKTVQKIGNVSGILQLSGEEDVFLISNSGNIIRLKVKEIPLVHRSTQGVRLINLASEEKLIGLTTVHRLE